MPVAVGSVLAGVAIGSSIDAVNNSKIQAAIADVSVIGQGVLAFYQDNGFFPFYVDGQRTGPTDDSYGFLVSENGTYPTDSTSGVGSSGWDVPVSATPWTTSGYFGDRPDYSSGAHGHATIEGHLVRNILGDPTASIVAKYLLRGDLRYTGDSQRGWHGPYVTALPKTDPWGDKYLINIRNLKLNSLPIDAVTGTRQKLAVAVISAGPNRNIDTPVDQKFDSFKVEGDDIVFRLD